MTLKRIILDFDPGVDDANALVLLIHAQNLGKVKIEAIIATNGNTSLYNVVRNTARLLNLLEKTNIPIYKGISESLLNENPLADHFYHGKDGFGDLQYDCEPDLSMVSEKPAAVAMGEIAKAYPGEVTLVCVGPLTNAAIFLKMYPDLELQEISIMGGNYTGVGNSTVAAEFNFYFDPEAARIVLEYTKCPILLLPWEATQTSKISSDWRFNICVNEKNKILTHIKRAEKSVYKQKPIWAPCDALLVGCLLYPEMVRETMVVAATVETQGQKTRGQVVIDHLKKEKRIENITIIKEFDSEAFKKLVMETVK